ncbi:GNAT family N-acetyltransferase [Sporanaerobacter acetigenes]|uniref:Protein N-acetyltransferase, RimJ/RimL family n=1 Tax=Sporanaerobacter acetigenes DSM 13106 TaxID=1123281 RepID=A0A1M5Z9L6_9FIRM|nr:GNAT family protein [Sporanaerobacter acetigenes]SHI20909.1 Protein N-acetyltransferase, RimJ/RimL family [Sporanaerobacter acetigenes DSM 13106]
MIEQISTERLVMRKFNKNDYQDVFEYLSDEDVMEHIEPPFTYKEAKKFVDTFICEDPSVFALVEKSSGKVIGHVIFHPYEYENVYEIGWIINKDYQGRGYAFEISNVLMEYGFEELKLHRIFATTVAGNNRSSSLLEKLNMKKEAVFRKANFHNEKWIDEYWYGILEEDYFEG